MYYHNNSLRLVVCLALGLSAVACSDDDSTGTGGGAASSTTNGSSSSQASSGSGSNQGGGGAGEGGGGAAAGTGGEGGGAPPSDPACGVDTAAFADVEPILTRSCANQYCHGNAGAPSGGLDLRASAAVGKLVDQDSASCSREQALVVPFKPSSSYLMNKLKEVGLCDPDESRMPPTAPLPAADIKTINDWICAGAPAR